MRAVVPAAHAVVLLLCGLALVILFLLPFSLPFPVLILLFISILLGALFSTLTSLLVLFWLLLCGLSIPLLVCFIFILLVWLLCVGRNAGTQSQQQNRFSDESDWLHDLITSIRMRSIFP